MCVRACMRACHMSIHACVYAYVDRAHFQLHLFVYQTSDCVENRISPIVFGWLMMWSPHDDDNMVKCIRHAITARSEWAYWLIEFDWLNYFLNHFPHCGCVFDNACWNLRLCWKEHKWLGKLHPEILCANGPVDVMWLLMRRVQFCRSVVWLLMINSQNCPVIMQLGRAACACVLCIKTSVSE